MNAYELADWLDRRRDAYEPNGWSADMLRQQADRIAELEKKCKWYDDTCRLSTDQQSAEPFIWLKQDFDGEWIEVHPNKGIPLYTTPQIKEFTQAELKEIVENNTKYDYVDYFNLALDMNKAILKKASEK
jgi:hypothetical protein